MDNTGVQTVESHKVLKPNSVITIPITDDFSFFRWWCIFLRPFIHLTDRETDVVAAFLQQRWELSKKVSDPAILDTMMMTDDVRQKVMDTCHLSQQHFYVVMSSLRKNNVIKNNIINPRLIPNVRKDDHGLFQLLVLFKGQ